MHWDNLRYVLEVANAKTLTKACERLGVSRSTIERHIRDLEADAGAVIFTRHKHRYELTETGLALYSDLQALEEKFRKLDHKLKSGKQNVSGGIAIAFEDPVLTVPFMRLLAVFGERFPAIELKIMSNVIFEQAAQMNADLFISGHEDELELNNSVHLFDFDWALYDASYLAGEKAEERSWIKWSKQKPFAAQRSWLEDTIPCSSKIVQVDSIEMSFLSALSGLGRTLLPAFIGDNDRALRRVDDLVEELDTKVHMAMLNGPDKGEAIPLFLEFAKTASMRSSKLLASSVKRDT